jgi:hypothetical protein
MCRLRKTGGAVDEDGNVISIPRLPSPVPRSRPAETGGWSAAEKLEHLLGMTLDRIQDYLSWPPDELDPHRLAVQAQVIRIVAMGRGEGRDAAPGPGSGGAFSALEGAGGGGRARPRGNEAVCRPGRGITPVRGKPAGGGGGPQKNGCPGERGAASRVPLRRELYWRYLCGHGYHTAYRVRSRLVF